jgi:hypothetical protein
MQKINPEDGPSNRSMDDGDKTGLVPVDNPILFEAHVGAPELDEPADCCNLLVHRTWFLPMTRVLICVITIGLYAVLGLMFYRSDYTKRKIKDSHDLIHEFNFYLPIYVIILQIGFLPPLYNLVFHNKWTAPPFDYPKEKRIIIDLHTVPALLWLVIVCIQVLAITYIEFPRWHRIQGMMLFMLFSIFIFTALYSAQVRLSPLGNHVIFMEWILGLSIAGFMSGGLISIVLAYVSGEDGKPNQDYFTNHKIFMMATIMGSGGPGIFRVLRTFREIFSRRLWRPKVYCQYAQINYTFWSRERGKAELSDEDR